MVQVKTAGDRQLSKELMSITIEQFLEMVIFKAMRSPLPSISTYIYGSTPVTSTQWF